MHVEGTNYTFRATGVSVNLQSGGIIETAHTIAAHCSIKKTQTYARFGDSVTLEKIGKIRL